MLKSTRNLQPNRLGEAAIVAFHDTRLFAAFGLPAEHFPADPPSA